MTPRALKKLAKRYMKVWTANSQGLLDIYADDDLVVEYTHFEKLEGKDNYKTMLRETYHFFPDIDVRCSKVIPNKKESSVTIFWNYYGTHQNGQLFGINPQNQKVNVNAMTVLRIEDKKVIHEKGIVDNMSLFMQLQQSKHEE